MSRNHHATSRQNTLAGLGAAILLLPVHAVAQQQLGSISVTAARIPTRVDALGSSVTIIDRQTIEDRQYRTVTDALQTVPGLRVVRSGPRGSQTSVFTRGAQANHTLVLINGQRAADPSTPGGAVNFANLTTDGVERIEVVRGPQSALYGSDAIAGVINIVTRKPPNDGVEGRIRLQGGTHRTGEGSVSLRGRDGPVAFSAGVSAAGTEGDSVTPARLRPQGAGAEDDGHSIYKATGRVNAELSDRLSLNVTGEVTDSRTELDDNPEDPNSDSETTRVLTRAELAGTFWDGRYRPTLSVSYSHFERDNRNRQDNLSNTVIDTQNAGQRVSAGFENAVEVNERHTLIAGAEVRHETFESGGTQTFGFLVRQPRSDADATTGGVYVNDVMQLTPRLSGSVGVRFDKPEDFDGQITWHAAPTYHFPETGTRLKASIGTGFKAPSLFQRFGFTPTNLGTAFRGNPNLNAATSFGGDLGVEQDAWDGRLTAGTTVFRTEIEDGVTTAFDQQGNATTVNNTDIDTWGVESFVRVRPTDALSLRLDHTYTDAEDEATGQHLVRRPSHRATLAARWTPGARWTVTGEVRALTGIRDIARGSGNRVSLDDYAVARITAEYELAERMAITGRIENLTDSDHEIADGFQAPGREVFLGTTVRF